MKEVITVITTIYQSGLLIAKKTSGWGWSFCQLSLYCELLQIRNLVAFTILGWVKEISNLSMVMY